eukprot:403348106
MDRQSTRSQDDTTSLRDSDAYNTKQQLNLNAGEQPQNTLNNTSDSINGNRIINGDEESGGFKIHRGLRDKLPGFLKNASDPGICLLHLIFKLAALVSYLLLNLFINNLVMVYICVIVSSAFDFYVVKNISGRVLVGLRWSQYVDEQGKEHWVFLSSDQVQQNDKINSRVFWFSSYATPAIWGLLFVWSILSFSPTNAIICVIAYLMAFTNLMAYIKCEKSHKSKISGYLFDQAKSRLSFSQLAKVGQIASKYSSAFTGGSAPKN